MLVDIALACAPLVVMVPAVITLLTSHVSCTPKGQLQKRVLGLLSPAEKLPAGIVGSAQIGRAYAVRCRDLRQGGDPSSPMTTLVLISASAAPSGNSIEMATASRASADRTVRSRWLPSKRDRTGSLP
jgi:hypothetical protein